MTVHKLTAGDGYAYYLRHTASADQRRPRGAELAQQQAKAGVPAGEWMGGAALALGVQGTVSEPQMRALYGEGRHPRADSIMIEEIEAGRTPRQALRATRLGALHARYGQDPSALTTAIEREHATYARRGGQPPDKKQARSLALKCAGREFRREYGRRPDDAGELAAYLARNTKPPRAATAGFDLTFTAPSTLQVLRKLGGPDVARAILDAHDQAAREAFAFAEQHAAATRTGKNGIAQHDALTGLVATRWRHFTSRAGDALLHDHIVIASKVQGPDGRWRSLDASLLYQQAVTISEHYNQRVLEIACQTLDLAVEPRSTATGRRPVMEIAGVDLRLAKANSTRGAAIGPRLEQMLQQYRIEHGKEPDARTRHRLHERAFLADRPDKKPPLPFEEMCALWREEAIAAFGIEAVDGLLARARAAAAKLRPATVPPVDVARTAAQILETVSAHRSTWNRHHLLSETRRHLLRTRRGDPAPAEIADAITDHALTQLCTPLEPPDLHTSFPPLERADGTSVYERRESRLYTTNTILLAEARLLNAARTPAIPAATNRNFTRATAFHQGPLDAGQRELAHVFATSENALVAAVGPAGAGKTTALRLAAATIADAGGRVIALAPSSRAASVLTSELALPAHTLHLWLRQRERANAGRQVNRDYQLRPGDVILVDEAGMAATAQLDAVVTDALAQGAHVRVIGDPAQLAAVEAGGALRMLASEPGAVHLTDVHRFTAPGEAAASLILRDSDPDHAFTWYRSQRRITAGTGDQMADTVFANWLHDLAQGRTSVMMAENTTTVTALNLRAQAFEHDQDPQPRSEGIALHDGTRATTGDLIVTRNNDRRRRVRGAKDWVKNGDLWRIERLTADGGAVIRHTAHRGRTTLTAAYLAAHTELGYASTIHRAQGITVDTAHALLTPSCSREAAYVAATRGRHHNRLYLAHTPDQSPTEVLGRIARNRSAQISAHQALRETQQDATSTTTLAAQYAYAAERANTLRLQQTVLAALPALDAQPLVLHDAWPALERALQQAEAAGFEPTTVLRRSYNQRAMRAAETPPVLMAWRLQRRIQDGQAAARRHADDPRPLQDLTDRQLQSLADTAARRHDDALHHLRRADTDVTNRPRPVTADGLPHPAWPDRPHGQLTARQLAGALHQTRQHTRHAALGEDHHDEPNPTALAATLRREQRLRRRMPLADRTREDWQRTRSAYAHLTPDDTRDRIRTNFHRQEDAQRALERAHTITARIDAEQRLRALLPDHPPPLPDHSGDLPDWLAPASVAHHPHTPIAWRRHLDQRRTVLLEQLRATGLLLAQDPPPWTATLGPVPAPAHRLRPQWEHIAALVEAWRTQRDLDPQTPGIGPRPADPEHGAAWDDLNQRIHQLGRRTRATRAAELRSDDPDTYRRAVLRRLDHARPPTPFTPLAWHPSLAAPPAGAAVAGPNYIPLPALATTALAAVLAGQQAPQAWIANIPAPDADDEDDQKLWHRLVTTIDDWRQRHHVTGDDPLGNPPTDQTRPEWDNLNEALSLYRHTRIQNRITSLHRTREGDRARLLAAAQIHTETGRRADTKRPPEPPEPRHQPGR